MTRAAADWSALEDAIAGEIVLARRRGMPAAIRSGGIVIDVTPMRSTSTA
jgi:hypothetical protein